MHPDELGFTAEPENPYRKPDLLGMRVDYVLAMDGERCEVRADSAEVLLDEPSDGVELSEH